MAMVYRDLNSFDQLKVYAEIVRENQSTMNQMEEKLYDAYDMIKELRMERAILQMRNKELQDMLGIDPDGQESVCKTE